MMKRLLFCFVFLIIASNTLAQIKVTFVINTKAWPASTPGMQKIFVAGSFNGWQAASEQWLFAVNAQGNFQLVQTLAPGSYEFKITRGTWDKVECSATGAPIGNRTLRVTHDTMVVLTIADWQDKHPIERKHTASPNVQVISEKFDIPQLGKQRRVWIYLPPGYQTSHKKYPVIYMHDGQNLFDAYTSGFGEWGVDEFMDSLKANATKAIIVGIDHGGDARVAEYSPYDSSYGKGLGDQYAAFLVETLKPYIDNHYRTLADAWHTTVAGSSMGGLISMYAALKYPQIFGNAGVFSPAFWINPPIYDYAKQHALKTSRFYFVCGSAESDKEVNDMQQMAGILHYKGLPEKNTPSTVVKDAKHNETQWRGDFPAFYSWLMSGK